jgi:hypothetical protein
MSKWQWRSDTDWVEFDATRAAALEAAFAAGTPLQVPVDKERYVDIPNMLQRRYDDPMKRREVRRIAGPALPAAPACSVFITPQMKLFEQSVFVLLVSLPKKREKLVKDISAAGGLVAALLSNKATHVVCSENELKSFPEQVKQALSLGIPIVSTEFILDSITEEIMQDQSQYLLSCSKPGAAAAVVPQASPAAVAAPTQLPVLSGTKATPYPFELIIDSVFPDVLKPGEGRFEGRVIWTSLNGCTSTAKGTFNGSVVHFVETDALIGDEVELPIAYDANLAASVHSPSAGAPAKDRKPGMGGTFKDAQGETGRWEVHVVS